MNSRGTTYQRIREILLGWGRNHLRAYPWRETREPYHVLLAEVLLHRTRADQVVPVYHRILRRYPTIHDLAVAQPEDLADILRPLGLHWRVPLLLDMAREVVSRFGGDIPADPEKLITLPGIGPYIAAATSCFAFNRPEPILDTNTVRVLGRLFRLDVRESSRRSRKFRALMAELLDRNQPRLFNLALIDFAALICTPTKPACDRCPLQSLCLYKDRPSQGCCSNNSS